MCLFDEKDVCLMEKVSLIKTLIKSSLFHQKVCALYTHTDIKVVKAKQNARRIL